MSTIYVFDDECSALATGADGDLLLIHDASAGVKKDITLSNVGNYLEARANTWSGTQTFSGAVAMQGNVDIGNAATDTVGFYGATKVDQGTMTATAVTALATATISAANTSAVWGFASSTVANAYVARIDQMQVDLDTLMARINSTGLVSISGL